MEASLFCLNTLGEASGTFEEVGDVGQIPSAIRASSAATPSPLFLGSGAASGMKSGPIRHSSDGD